MANVNIAAGVVEPGIVGVLVGAGQDVHGIVGLMGVGVVRIEGYASRNAAAQADLKRLVIGIDEVAESPDLPEVRAELIRSKREGREVEFFPGVCRAGGTFHAAIGYV